MSRERLKRIWTNMKHRCHGQGTKDKNYAYYRDRGIEVCSEWRNDFGAFAEWSLANGYADGLTIDRIDCDGDYCPGNCRWVTVSENNKNHYHSGIRPKVKKKVRHPKPYFSESERQIVHAYSISPAFAGKPEITRWVQLVNSPERYFDDAEMAEVERMRNVIRIMALMHGMSPERKGAVLAVADAFVKESESKNYRNGVNNEIIN